MRKPFLVATSLALVVLAFTQELEIASSASPLARDPGPRLTAPDAGAPLPGLTKKEEAFFMAGRTEFDSAEEVKDGLGPTMNLDSCGGCHSQPASGGTSPAINPQVV